MKNVEKMLHKKFSSSIVRINGEWFSPTQDLIDYINDNSLVFTLEINNIKFLFTGDIEQDAEKQFVYENKLINVDILKLAHHGSKTSTTEIFLKNINI